MVLVVIKTFDILELVALRNGQPVSLTDIASELRLNQATAANIIKTMVSKEYLEHIGRKKGYRLGPAAHRLTNDTPYGQELVLAAREVMEELTAAVNESSILGSLRNGKRYILHVVNSNQEVQVQVRSDRNVYETASGRLLLAYLSPKELERFIQQNGLPDKTLWKEGSTAKGLTSSLEKIKKDGYVMTHLSNRHVRGFAVPVFNDGLVVAGLSVFLPDYRYSVVKQKNIIQSLKRSSISITSKLEKN
ncbi:MAG: helix-turn-helix domain-containing protein [Gemmatimonadaceae bacterium]|nr:helix-turn-helix domain-containing protein [Chitinophagaceae bacterium]